MWDNYIQLQTYYRNRKNYLALRRSKEVLKAIKMQLKLDKKSFGIISYFESEEVSFNLNKLGETRCF